MFFLFAVHATASLLDFTTAVIVMPADASARQRKAGVVLAEEIEKRTQLRVRTVPEQPAGVPAFVLRKQPGGKPEGFGFVSSEPGGVPVAMVTGNDDRGVLFGTGYLLRQLHMGRQRLELESGIHISTAPAIPIRGHQLGYRPKTNAYDGWTVAIWDQYIRELAIFGTNTIELIPPRSDDARDSPHFPLPPMDMMVEMSRIADEYGLDVSIWYPAMDRDYSNPETVEFALKEWGEVFRRLPRIDAVFVPGGDPGHTQPKYLMALLEKQTANLHRYHPKAQMWMSPQSFSKEWMAEFYGILKNEPNWLAGVVFGPQTMYSLPEVRAQVPRRYPIRFYPDITHSVHSQFPVPDWDSAFELTEGREGINPRPLGEAVIFRKYMPLSAGFVTYSEGCNDDVNKMVWSSLGWNPSVDIKTVLTEYARLFISGDFASGFAEGLLSLERNWKGPLIANAGVDTTLLQFQEMERRATPQTKLSWRFQQALYRAYYDAFVRSRLIAETAQEERALGELQQAKRVGSITAMAAAESVLDADVRSERARDLRARVFELAEALFQSIRMQLSVARYQAIGLERGANLDAIDFSLNDRVWLKNRFTEIRALENERDRLTRIDEIVNWTNPGAAGFYDDLGNAAQQPHLVPGEGFEQDPDFLHSALIGFADRRPAQGWRMSWYNHAESLFDEPLRLRYTGLDRNAHYKVRVVYGGEMLRVPVRLVANGSIEIHPFRDKQFPPVPAEFEIPIEATQGGTLTLEWTRPPGLGGNGRGCQVSEVWLIRE